MPDRLATSRFEIAVVAAQVVAVWTGRWRSTKHSRGDSVFALVLRVFAYADVLWIFSCLSWAITPLSVHVAFTLALTAFSDIGLPSVYRFSDTELVKCPRIGSYHWQLSTFSKHRFIFIIGCRAHASVRRSHDKELLVAIGNLNFFLISGRGDCG